MDPVARGASAKDMVVAGRADGATHDVTCAVCARIDPVARGAFLGLANVLVIALGIAIREHGGFEAFAALSIIGALPALLAGLLIGIIADRTGRWQVTTRLVVIITPALLVVMFIGCAVGFDAYVTLSFMPTIAAALYLEQRTRSPSRVPPALGRARA